MKKFMVVAVAVLLMASPAMVKANYTIGFDNLGGANEDPYTGSSEGGFTITTPFGSWFQAQAFGNPTPSIFDGPVGSPGVAHLNITGGVFTFLSFDFSCNNGPGFYEVTGSLGGVQQFDQFGTLAAQFSPFVFSTQASLFSGMVVDNLLIQVFPNGTDATSINLDNIVLGTSTPDNGATLLLLGMGLIMVVSTRRYLCARTN